MKRALLIGALAFFNSLAAQAQAQTAKPPAQAKAAAAKPGRMAMNDTLRQALHAVPIDGFAAVFQQLSGLEVPDEPTSKFISRRGRIPGIQRDVQIHVDKGSGQVAFVVLEGSIKITDLGFARLFKRGTLDRIAGTDLVDPIFSVSLLEGDLKTEGLPKAFKDVIARSYYNVPSINVKPGLQVYSKVTVGGVLGKVLESGLGIPAKDFTMRAGVTGDAPTTPRSKSQAQDKLEADEQMRDMVAKYKEEQEEQEKEAAKKKALAEGKKAPEESTVPEMFVELQMRPGATVSGPLGLSAITLSDVTLFLNNQGKVGYKGNARVAGVDKTLLAFYEGPINPSGALDFAEFNMGFASPTLTLADAAQIGMAMSTPGSRLMPGMDKVNGAIRPLLKPLGAFVLRNPNKVQTYKVGDEFPDIAAFNVAAIGPLGEIDKQKGPLLKVVGNATVLGQQMAGMNVYMSTSGLHGTTSGNLTLDLSKVGLGKPGITMSAKTDITDAKQAIGLGGSFAGRGLNIAMNASEISVSSPANCTIPVEVSGSLKYPQGTPTFAQVTSALNGVNVDPAKIPQCAGEALKAAYKWIENNGAKLGGYTVAAAKEAGKALESAGGAVVDAGKAAADAVRSAEESSRKAADAAARAATAAAANAANQAAHAAEAAAHAAAHAAANAASGAVSAVGNAFGGGGEKTCNQRIRWLTDQGNVPTPAVTEALINTIYLPVKVKAGTARGLGAHLAGFGQQWARAHDALSVIEQRWNAAHPAPLHVQRFASYHDGNDPLPEQIRGRWPRGLDTSAFSRTPRAPVKVSPTLELNVISAYLEGGARDFDALVGWRKYAPATANEPGWRGRNEGERLWFRCAAVWTANFPNRTAAAWQTFLPTNKGNPDAMFMSHDNYLGVQRGLLERINQKAAEIDLFTVWLADFTAAWIYRSARFENDLARKMDEKVARAVAPLRDRPETSAAVEKQWKEYQAAVASYRMQAQAIMNFTGIPDRKGAADVVDRVIRSSTALENAVKLAGEDKKDAAKAEPAAK